MNDAMLHDNTHMLRGMYAICHVCLDTTTQLNATHIDMKLKHDEGKRQEKAIYS